MAAKMMPLLSATERSEVGSLANYRYSLLTASACYALLTPHYWLGRGPDQRLRGLDPGS
jgi:hypothetical protein